MLRTAPANDIISIRALIDSVSGLWHDEWRADAPERALHASDGLTLVWKEQCNLLGFGCAHDVGFLSYLNSLVVTESARGKGIGLSIL